MTSDVAYEPDGNIPPDFRVAGKLAVEVRTLNENYFGGEVPRGLERDQIRIESAVEAALREFDQEVPGEAYWVRLDFSRPLGNLKHLKREIRQRLRAFLASCRSTPYEIIRRNGIAITLLKAEKPHRQTFRIVMQSDRNSGGAVAGIYVRNIRYCIDEKTEKIRPFRERYSRWWLVLVDFLSGLSRDDPEDERELKTVEEHLTKPPLWEKVLVLRPRTETELIHIHRDRDSPCREPLPHHPTDQEVP